MKIIQVGEYQYRINYSYKIAVDALDKLIEWMKEVGHSASAYGEGIMQDDNCTIDAPVLIADIVDNILKPELYENREG